MKDKQLLLAVLAHLEREKTVSIPQLSKMLNVSERKVYDALETLVFAYDAASIRLNLHDSYASLEMHGVDRLLRLTPTEAGTLVDALLSVGFSTGDELVCQLLETKSALESTEHVAEPRMQTVVAADNVSVVQAVAAACEDEAHHLLQIAYRGQDDGIAQPRIVEPTGIFSKMDHRYLQAFCREAKGWRSFRLDRIEEAHPLEKTFEPRDGAPSVNNAFKSGAVTARVLIDAGCEPQWRGLRIINTRVDGSRVASIPWTGSSWLPRHIVAQLGDVLPLNPPELIIACYAIAG